MTSIKRPIAHLVYIVEAVDIMGIVIRRDEVSVEHALDESNVLALFRMGCGGIPMFLS